MASSLSRYPRHSLLAVALLLVAVVTACQHNPAATDAAPQGPPAATPDATGFRAFTADSYWNTPATGARVHPDSEAIIDFLRSDSTADGCTLLSGIGSNEWGMPIYWASASDREYDVESTKYDVPPEFGSLRIPLGAKPMRGSDHEMVVYDLDRGTVAQLYRARYDEDRDRWTVRGGSIAYLDSNGLDGSLPESDDPRNRGTFRGYNGAVAAIRRDEVQKGSVEHVVKVGVNTAHVDHVFPMTGSDGDLKKQRAPKQGMRLRIRSDVDLERYDLHPQALVIARALQTYGMMVADSTGGPVELKLEDAANGREPAWEIREDALCAIPIDSYEVVDPSHFEDGGT